MSTPKTQMTALHRSDLQSVTRKLAESAQITQKEGSSEQKSCSNKNKGTMGSTSNELRVNTPQEKVAERVIHFHMDIFWEILLRLPIEAILRCQCVCKTWCDVIKNPTFITKQMILSSKRSLRFICDNRLKAPVRTLQSSSLQPANGPRRLFLLDIEDGKARKMPINELSGKEIIYSHNGLLCFVGKSCVNQPSFTICNPITNETIALTLGGDIKNDDHSQVGFCFVPERQRYVIVHVSLTDSQEYGRVTHFYIRTSGQGVWRMLAHPPCITNNHMIEQTIYWNGGFHWRVSKRHGFPGCDGCILSFDTIHEKFHVISLPDDIPKNHLNLLVLKGRLTLLERIRNKMKLWEVTGDKLGEYTLVYRESYILRFAYSLVSRVTENENLLTYKHPEDNQQGGVTTFIDFVVASNAMRPHKILQIDGLPIHFKTIPYNPSLFSPHSMGFT